MAEKLPIANYAGELKELQSGDTVGGVLASGGNDSIIYTNGSGVPTTAPTNFTFNGTKMALGQQTPTAFLDIKGTTEQLRLRYDDSNYVSITIGSTGITTLDVTGSSPAFRVNAATSIFSMPRGTTPRIQIGGRDDTAWSNNEEIGSVDFYNADSDQAGVAARIRSQRGAVSGSGAQMSFWTSLNGSPAGALTQQFTIDETGTLSGNDKHFILPAIGGSIVTDSTTGIYWHRDSASVGSADYGIYRTSGAWTASDYQQLKIQFNSGIIIDGGSAFSTYSGTVIQPSAGNVGMGTGTNTVAAKLHIIRTSEQLRVGYDTSNYLKFTISSAGVATIEAVGSAPAIQLGNATSKKIGFFGKAPVVQPTALTAQLSQITYGAVTFDYAIQSVTLGGYGFANQNEGDTLVAVVENLQQRMGEIETKFKNLGLLA